MSKVRTQAVEDAGEGVTTYNSSDSDDLHLASLSTIASSSSEKEAAKKAQEALTKKL